MGRKPLISGRIRLPAAPFAAVSAARVDVSWNAGMERNRPGMEQNGRRLEQKRQHPERKACLLERAWNRRLRFPAPGGED
jgi:hypothetical protein